MILSDLGNQFDKGVPVELGIPPGALWRAGAASAIRFKAASYKCAIPGAEQKFDLKNPADLPFWFGCRSSEFI